MTVRSGQEGVRLAPGLSAIMNERRRLIGLRRLTATACRQGASSTLEGAA